MICSREILSKHQRYDRMKESQMSEMSIGEILVSLIGIEVVTKEPSQ